MARTEAGSPERELVRKIRDAGTVGPSGEGSPLATGVQMEAFLQLPKGMACKCSHSLPTSVPPSDV